ncbi:MAG: SAM-dependent chlorinase/fluorinase [Bacteroidales bacterium]|nr:SAM-dependent chlorinase/fluorinase [Bacteroidales bacterium]
MRKFITLLTDYSVYDYYETILIGKLYSLCPDAVIVSQRVYKKHDIKTAGFFLAQYYKDFPENTLHISLVNDAHSEHQDMLLIQYSKCFVLTFNNGMISFLLDDPLKIWLIDQQNIVTPSFKEYDFISKVVQSWLRGNIDENFCEMTYNVERRLMVKPIIEKNSIVCHVIHTDSYGNCITNLHEDDFQKLAAGRRYKITIGKYVLDRIVWDYPEAGYSELVALFGKHGYLEIAIVIDNACQLLGLREGSTIRIEFM